MNAIHADVTLTLIVTDDLTTTVQTTPVQATFRYDPADPYAVTVDLDVLQDKPVVWTFARELLRDGLRGAAGHGDVRVRPVPPQRTAIDLHSPFGDAAFEAPRAAVSAFLDRAYRLVPVGAETAVAQAALDAFPWEAS